MVLFYLEDGMTVHTRDSSKTRWPPAIFVTIKHGHVGVAKLLLAAGADMDGRFYNG